MTLIGSRWAAGALALLGLTGMALRGQVLSLAQVDNFAGHPRVVVISDIGNEPDDQMSFVRLLLYSNELDLEAMIATTSTWQKTAAHPETMHALIHAYGEVRGNLLKHAAGWPDSAELDAHIFAGQTGDGMAANGTGKMSEGAKAILRAVDREDDRPVWVCIWGDANTLAQALQEVRATRTPDAIEKFVTKLRPYSISDQDDAGPWIRREFPGLFYIVDHPLRPAASTNAHQCDLSIALISAHEFDMHGEG